MAGVPFVMSAVYLTLVVSFVISLLESGFCAITLKQTFRRWGKFLLLLVVLAILIQVLTVWQGRVV